jgi:hypothetical protein
VRVYEIWYWRRADGVVEITQAWGRDGVRLRAIKNTGTTEDARLRLVRLQRAREAHGYRLETTWTAGAEAERHVERWTAPSRPRPSNARQLELWPFGAPPDVLEGAPAKRTA